MASPNPDPRSRRSMPSTGEVWRTAFMGIVLAACVFLVFFEGPGDRMDLGQTPPRIEVRVEVPELDRELLAGVRDDTVNARLMVEELPLAHLLESSLNVVPSVARELGMPATEFPIAELRRDPARHRGRYLWYSGTLEGLSTRDGHPLSGYQIHQGWIRTRNGEVVLFTVSLPPREQLSIGDFVRVEGFFMKLRDSRLHPADVEQAPLLVGPAVHPDYELWGEVAELDPFILAQINDGSFDEQGLPVELGDMPVPLIDSEDVPLWHLAAYARTVGPARSDAEWRRTAPLVTKERFHSYRRSTPESRRDLRGEPIRILGTFVFQSYQPARLNPLGVEHWTEAWVQVRDLGGLLIPIWIPGRVTDYPRGASIDCRAFFYRLYAYEAESGDVQWVPLFVAEDLQPLTSPPPHPVTGPLKWGFLGLVVLVILLFFRMSRRERIQTQEQDAALIRRRQRRRAKMQAQSAHEPPNRAEV